MNFGFPSFVAMSTVVWANTGRSLTSLGSSMAVVAAAQNQSLPASSNTTFAPGAGVMAWANSGAKAGAAGTAVYSFSDGTTDFQILSITAGQTGFSGMVAVINNIVLKLKNNDAANAAVYSYVMNQFVI